MQTERFCRDYAGAVPFAANSNEVRPFEDETKTALVPDKTIFYPEGGGKSADRGSNNNFPPLSMIKAAAGSFG